MKLDKKQNRIRRARKGRSKIRQLEALRLALTEVNNTGRPATSP